jgi:hypothetical protein
LAIRIHRARRRRTVLTLAIALFCVWPFSDHALGQEPQERPPIEAEQPPQDSHEPLVNVRRPYRAYFGGATFERRRSSGLDVSGSAFEVWDENLLADISSPDTSSGLAIDGFYTNLAGDVTYARNASFLDISARGGMDARYYTGLGKFAATGYRGGFGLSRMSSLTTLRVDQTVSHAPVFLVGLFADALPTAPGGAALPGTAYAITDDRSVTAATSGDFARRLSIRTQLIFTGGYRRTHYLVDGPRGSDLTTLDAGGSYRYRLTEESDLRLGYSYRRARYSGAQTDGPLLQEPAEHNILSGIVYNPAVSDSRRTFFMFEGGFAFVNAPAATNAFETRRQLRIIADAALAHQLGETWLVVGAFTRGSGFIEGLSGPVFTDAISATASGFVNSRTDLLASLAYTNGEPSRVGAENAFSTTTATGRVRYALSSQWAITGEYVFYAYDFTRTLGLAARIAPRVKRNSVRGGLTLWLPIHRP